MLVVSGRRKSKMEFTIDRMIKSPTDTDRCVASINSLINGAETANPAEEGTCTRSEEHTSELQSRSDLVCRLLLEKKKKRLHTKTNLPCEFESWRPLLAFIPNATPRRTDFANFECLRIKFRATQREPAIIASFSIF